MPELTIEIMFQCADYEQFNRTYKSSRGNKEYRVWYSQAAGYRGGCWEASFECNCQGYKYSKATPYKQCKHTRQAMKEFCGWFQQAEGGDATKYTETEIDPITEEEREVTKWTCPKCGGEAVPVRVGV